MAAKFTIERILRDDNDETGQNIREWMLEANNGIIFMRRRDGGEFIIFRTDDIGLLKEDLDRIVFMGVSSALTDAQDGVRRVRQSGDGFWECDACAVKPGSPTLCAGCVHNRDTISLLMKAKK